MARLITCLKYLIYYVNRCWWEALAAFTWLLYEVLMDGKVGFTTSMDSLLCTYIILAYRIVSHPKTTPSTLFNRNIRFCEELRSKIRRFFLKKTCYYLSIVVSWQKQRTPTLNFVRVLRQSRFQERAIFLGNTTIFSFQLMTCSTETPPPISKQQPDMVVQWCQFGFNVDHRRAPD